METTDAGLMPAGIQSLDIWSVAGAGRQGAQRLDFGILVPSWCQT
jgi:hypothetical protein